MTYQQLFDKLSKMSFDELGQEAIVFDTDEQDYFPIIALKAVGDPNDALEEGHLILII